MLVDITDKVVLVTGGAKGIGGELSYRLAKEKAKVIINYNESKDEAEQLLTKIEKFNKNCIVFRADVTNYDEVVEMSNFIRGRYGDIDVLINNAGVCDDNLLPMLTLKQWEKVINVNLTGTYICTRVFSKSMIKKRKGKILNIVSIKGQEGCVGQANYSSSKAGVIAFTKTIAKELGQFNIAVNAICPAFIVTDLNRDNERKKQIAKERSLLDLNEGLNDLCNFIMFYVSDKVKSVSAQVINWDSRQ